MKLRILRFGSDEDGDVRVGVLPQSEEILIGGTSFGTRGVCIGFSTSQTWEEARTGLLFSDLEQRWSSRHGANLGTGSAPTLCMNAPMSETTLATSRLRKIEV